MNIRRRWPELALVGLLGFGAQAAACGDDAYRITVQNVDTVAYTARSWDDAIMSLDDTARWRPYVQGLDDITSQAEMGGVRASLKQRTQQALSAVGDDLVCDVVTGDLPEDRDALIEAVLFKAASAGVAFVAREDAGKFVDEVMEFIQSTSGQGAYLQHRCGQALDSGL